MSSLIVDIERLYQRTFGSKPYKVGESTFKDAQEPGYKLNGQNDVQVYAPDGSLLQTTFMGIEIWLPTRMRNLPADLFENGELFMPFTVVRITGSSDIIRTPLLERRGKVKELYSIDDYKISIKGFLIDSDRVFPYDELKALKKLHEMGTAFSLDNALTNVFLVNEETEPDKVVITGFDLPEVEGGRKHIRPFSMSLESDSIFTLEWNG